HSAVIVRRNPVGPCRLDFVSKDVSRFGLAAILRDGCTQGVHPPQDDVGMVERFPASSPRFRGDDDGYMREHKAIDRCRSPIGRKLMARIVHIALKVEDLEKATKFYEDVFGIYQLKTGHARGHTSRHMTEGTIDLALMTYDSEDEPEAKLS